MEDVKEAVMRGSNTMIADKTEMQWSRDYQTR